MIDLHTHSIFSDGSDEPEALLEHAGAAGLSAVALTDHDTLDGLERASAAAETHGIELVRGCEVSCVVEGGGVAHVLCYFVSEAASPLSEELARLRGDRERRNEQMIERLVALGLPITFEEVDKEAGGKGIGRPHFAAVLVRNGAASSIQDAFDRLLAKGSPGYVPKARVEIPEVIELARVSGALAVLAHPLSLGLEDGALVAMISSLATRGLAGIECTYGRYDLSTRASLVELARAHSLVPTGGSDFHGTYKPDLSIGTGTGDLAVDDVVLEELKERLAALDT